MSTRTPSVTYRRVSTNRQEASLDQQQEWARQAARREGLDLVADFQDEAIPGSEFGSRRPGLAELVAYVEKRGDIGAVVVWDGDRLSRGDSIQTAALIHQLVQAGCTRMLTQEGWTDFGSDLDRVLFNLRQDLSRAGYSKSLSKNMARSVLSRAKLGLWPCGRLPYGYRRGGDGKLAVHEEEAEVVRWMFAAYLDASMSLATVVQKLRGMPGPSAARVWAKDMVRHVLTNEVYTGTFTWGKLPQGKYHRVQGGEVVAAPAGYRRGKRWAKEGVIRIEDNHPALIDRETFDAVQRKLHSNRKRTTPIPGGGGWVLTGLVCCGDCGETMTGRSLRLRQKLASGPKEYIYHRYCCKRAMRLGSWACRANSAAQEVILREVGRLIEEAFDPARELFAEMQTEVERQVRERTGEAAKQAAGLQARIGELDRRLAKAAKRLAVCEDDLAPLVSAQIREWRAEREKLEAERQALTRAAEEDAAALERVRGALAAVREMGQAIHEATPEELRPLLEAVVQKITVHFDPRAGKGKSRVTDLEVDFVPEVAHLFGFRP